MRREKEQAERFNLVFGSINLLGAISLLIVLLTVDLAPDAFNGLLTLCFLLGMCGAVLLIFGGKEAFMKLGIVERVRERRRIAAAVALMERYEGVDLMSTPEARALPTPIYECEGCRSSYDKTADRIYWVGDQPLLSAGWYCDECVDKLEGKSRHDRLNMEIFLLMLDSDIGAD